MNSNNPSSGDLFLASMADYYQRPFSLFHDEIERNGFNIDQPHGIRERYWSLIPKKEYSSTKARKFLNQYFAMAENELKGLISKQSLMYWIHLYRRLMPAPAGLNKDPLTTGIVRANLEAAVQKYATIDLCNRVGIVGDIGIENVFRGLLLEDEFEPERKILSRAKQLVLTEFGPTELEEFYQAEKLSYEIWRCSAQLRSVAKGLPLIVDASSHLVYDDGTEAQNQLIESYDVRIRNFSNPYVTRTGVVFEPAGNPGDAGFILIPRYNIDGVLSTEFDEYFDKVYDLKLSIPVYFNFLFVPFFIRQYREAHLPYAQAFVEKHGVKLDAVLAVIASLCYRISFACRDTGGLAISRYWMRAYEGPVPSKQVVDELLGFLPAANHILGISNDILIKDDVLSAIGFLSLTDDSRLDIDLNFAGPHSVFLPIGPDRLVVDYCWIGRRLYDLFHGLTIDDQNFKGNALEEIVRFRSPYLPTKPLKSNNGESRQIDASFKCDRSFVIVECKANANSIGFTKGDPKSIRFRRDKIDEALGEVDDKARWLQANPVGANYNIAEFDRIIPLVVTPFVEFIPEATTFYWLSSELPRVLTINELLLALENDVFEGEILWCYLLQRQNSI